MLVPSAWRASHYFKEWWDLNLACRALDNLLYVAAVNRCGQSGRKFLRAKVRLSVQSGEVLAAFDVEEEGILYQEIDLERVAKEREFNTVLTDRHPEDYKILSDR